ncbi:hypothetical protein N7535_003900 [Penicillium sp. DV-2018c]|nr:hypothetical protein N7535_003900 [Penicillium sp. DV-2018c]
MASISLPQSQAGFPPHFDTSNQSTPSTDRRPMHTQLPNPPYVFPTNDSDTPDTQPETVRYRERPALPAFSFNPGAEQESSHVSAPALPNPRANGHRRRPSEFVGNDHLVTPETLGTGHNRTSSMIDQTLPPPGPGVGRVPGRRNHAHRRSAAISGVDLNAITKALGPNSGPGSAPCTPADPNRKSVTNIPPRPVSQSAMSIGRPTPPASPQFPASVPPVPPIPAAIQETMILNGKTSTVERPTPDVSHGASESTITIKVQPSVEDPDTPDPLMRRPEYNPKPRPKTADASLAVDFMQMQNDDSTSIKRSHSAAGHSRSRLSKSNPHLESTLSSDDLQSTDTTRPSFSETDTSGDEAAGNTSDNKSPLKSKKKKQKRVRSWAGHILTRTKSKGKGKRPAKADTEEETPVPHDRAPRPPALTRTNSGTGSALDVDFDNDDVVVIRTPTNPAMPPAALEPIGTDRQDDGAHPRSGQSLESAWKPRSFYEQDLGTHANMLSSPVIDLDAALGPFNTPDMRPVTQGAHNKNFSVATQRMYSGGRRGEFVGPEMRYHRRTESAPVMQPFDRSALGAFRLGPTSAVETPDVFDEEEEDAFLAATQSPKTERPSSSTTNSVVKSSLEDDDKSAHSSDSADTGDTLTRAPTRSISSQHAGLGIQQVDGQPSSQQQPAMSAAEQVQNANNPFAKKPRSPVEILKTEEPAHNSIAPPSPDVSPRFLAVDKRPSTSPVELLPSIPPFTLPGVSPSDSSFPSPDTSRSIAASSMTDRNFSSHSYHQLPCSEYPYASVEDVPSLTSSASTMTNTLNRFSAASFFPRGRVSTDRAASFSAAGTRRTSQANASKRSSLASLSKLVGGPHSERSKLNQEEKPPGDTSERTKKKGHRLSRMMHFWKVKDKEKSSTGEASADERPPS